MQGSDNVEYKNKPNFTPTEEELEKQKKEMLFEMNKLDNELRKAKKKKIIIIASVVILSFILFKIFVGEINVTIPNLASQHRNRQYDVRVNNTSVDVGVEETKKTTIIPFIMYISDFSSHRFTGEMNINNMKYEMGTSIILNIDSYECYTQNDNIQLSCVSSSGNVKKIKVSDTTYTLRIKRLNRAETIIYNGKFISDISKYLTDNGKYRIFITGKYKNITSTIYFDLEVI